MDESLINQFDSHFDKIKDVITPKGISDLILHNKGKDHFRENDISDGHHTFEELYGFRLAYHALLFNEWAYMHRFVGEDLVKNPYDVHKSWLHHDGKECFEDSKHKWFIVVAMLPSGQVSNHYKAEHWSKFSVPVAEKAKYPFDGHTSQDVLKRLMELFF